MEIWSLILTVFFGIVSVASLIIEVSEVLRKKIEQKSEDHQIFAIAPFRSAA